MLVIWYVDAGNTSHSTFSNHLVVTAIYAPPKVGRAFSAAGAKAQHSSDIVTKNQLGLNPDAACVGDPCCRSLAPHPYGAQLLQFLQIFFTDARTFISLLPLA